jgi:DNA-binding transcriptional ArsR family regulator
MDILKILSEGGRTPSFISKKLDKSDATIVEHLEKLEKVGLVKKVEQPGKKWVFYTLTDRGHGIVSTKSRRLVIILATSLLTFIGGLFSFSQYYSQFDYTTMMKAPLAEISRSMPEVTATVTPLFLYLSIALFSISLIEFAFYFIQKSKRYKYVQ